MIYILYALKETLEGSQSMLDAVENLIRELIEAEFKTLDVVSSTHQFIPQYPDANRIKINQHHYIAMSHPFHQLTFWRMIFKEKSPIIIKLNKDNDDRYFPTQLDVPHKDPSSDLTITLVHQKPLKAIKKRVFEVSYNKETQHVVHLEFTTWPDFGVPVFQDLSSLLLVLNSERKNLNDHDPITVHCKQGFGRTGTFIAIDSTQGIHRPNVVDVVKKLRAQRHSSMVENAEQYRLIYEFSSHSKGQ